jgi:hypothetical protein
LTIDPSTEIRWAADLTSNHWTHQIIQVKSVYVHRRSGLMQ